MSDHVAATRPGECHHRERYRQQASGMHVLRSGHLAEHGVRPSTFCAHARGRATSVCATAKPIRLSIQTISGKKTPEASPTHATPPQGDGSRAACRPGSTARRQEQPPTTCNVSKSDRPCASHTGARTSTSTSRDRRLLSYVTPSPLPQRTRIACTTAQDQTRHSTGTEHRRKRPTHRVAHTWYPSSIPRVGPAPQS